MRCYKIWFSLVALVTALSASAGTFVQFRTSLGDIEVELYDQDKPVTVQNFLRYLQQGDYANTFIHRCVPGFVAQGGGYGVINPLSTSPFSLTNIFAVTSYGAITNEYHVGRRLSNTYGTMAMAKVGDNVDSATSQWFFNLNDNSTNLDTNNGGFTVFGRVLSGTNVLAAFSRRDNGNGLLTLTWRDGQGGIAWQFADLPVLYSGYTWPGYADLVYVDITLLRVQVKTSAAGGRQISWNSVSNRVNTVEYTRQFPPDWKLLTTRTGTGQTISVTDEALGNDATPRFYRVTVDYP